MMFKRENGNWTVDVDLVMLYLVVFIGIIALGIKSIRWAIES